LKRTITMAGEGGNYYGLPLYAERLLFVLDTSGSMSGERLLAAKRELVRAINGLPEHVHFGVVIYNDRVDRWQKELQPADAKNKRSALAFIDGQGAHSRTASYDALEAGLAFDTEAIYFLSDGAPTAGKIVAPVDILAAIQQVNKARRVSIYTIGIAPGFSGSVTDTFLKTLAEQNFGQYRRIDG
jgi:Ca-activated chloride channel family protein